MKDGKTLPDQAAGNGMAIEEFFSREVIPATSDAEHQSVEVFEGVWALPMAASEDPNDEGAVWLARESDEKLAS